MNDEHNFEDAVEFDDLVARTLAESASGPSPAPHVRERMMARVAETASIPRGFSLHLAASDEWQPYPIAGIRMRVLAIKRLSPEVLLILYSGHAALLDDTVEGLPPHWVHARLQKPFPPERLLQLLHAAHHR